MKLIHFNEIDSTNKYLLDNVNALEDKTFCVADFQSSGRGRLGRSWNALPKENLLFSLLLKDVKLTNPELITLCAGVAICKSLSSISSNTLIKWPNDIYLNGKKVCGILTQGTNFDNIQHIVIGLGINVNQTCFDGDYRRNPTSLKLEVGRDFDTIEVFNKIYPVLLNELNLLFNNDFSFIDYLNTNLYGKESKVKYNEDIYTIVKINQDGSIKLKINNSYIDVSTGEIVFL